MVKNTQQTTDIKQRKAFNFLRSYYDVLEEINDDKDKLDYLIAIFKRQFEGVEPTLTGISKLCYIGQKHSIDASRNGWEIREGWVNPTTPPYGGGGQGGIGHPTKGDTQPHSGYSVMTTEGGIQPPYQQEQVKEKVKEKVKEEVNKELIGKNFNEKQFYEKNKATIHFLMDNYNLDLDAAIELQIQNEEVDNAISRIFN